MVGLDLLTVIRSNFKNLVILWGVVVTLNAACHSFPPIVALRVLLGVLEASAAPRYVKVRTPRDC
jgi:hypothetical protein